MTRRSCAARGAVLTLTLTLAMSLGGCGSVTSSTEEYPISSLRTDPDGLSLVASYLGGSCDGAARLEVSESGKTVHVRVVVDVPDTACDAAGHLRSVHGRLDEPLGTRTVLAGSQQIVPFPGEQVLRPSTSAPKLVVGFEVGGTDQSDASASGSNARPLTTTSWSTTFSDSDHPCNLVSVDQNTTSTEFSVPGSTAEGLRKFGAVTAHLYRDQSSDGSAVRWTLAWAQDGGSVDVRSEGNCAGTPIIGPDELVKIAASLRPL